MTPSDVVTQDDLHAFVDGHLDPAAQSFVEAWLADHPEDAAKVHAYRLQNRLFQDAFDPVLSEGVPAEMAALVNGSARDTGKHMGTWMRIAASIVLLILGGVGGWLAHGLSGPASAPPGPTVADQAMGAHRVFVAEVRHPVEVPATQEAHLAAWLSKRLGTKLTAPHLQDLGYALVGGRLLAEGSRPAAQFMYEDSGGRRVTLYVRGADAAADTAFRYVSSEGVSAFYWMEGAFAYALVAPLDRADLLVIAEKAYRDLEAAR